MGNKFKVGQRVKILHHIGTCLENATGTISEIDNNIYKVDMDKSTRLCGQYSLWFYESYLEALDKKEELKKEIRRLNKIIKRQDKYIKWLIATNDIKF